MNPNDPGPLPKSDRADELQQESILALRAFLPHTRFLFRDERVDDKGVDGALELKIDGHVTNFRAQVQLKGTDDDATNVDGSVSLRVETSKLNYLLNGHSPIYVLWIAPRNELRFAWAHDERRRLDTVNSGWTKQKTVTLRVDTVLTPSVIDDIHARILREGRLQRQIHDRLAQTSMIETLALGINPQSLALTDPVEIRKLIHESGLSIVAAGYAADILHMERFLNPADSGDPRIRLVVGYAQAETGDYLSARGTLAKSLARRDALSPVDQHLLDALMNGCDFRSGRVDMAQYLAREKEFATRAPGQFAFQHELETRRHEHLSIRDVHQRQSAWKELRDLVARILSDRTVSPTFKLKARLAQLYADTLEAGTKHTGSAMRLLMRRDMGLDDVTPGVLADLRQIQNPSDLLIEESNRVVADAIEEGHPLLIAEALVTQVIVLLDNARNERYIHASLKQPMPSMQKGRADDIRQNLEQAVTIFQTAGSLELEIWAKLYLADWLEVCGDTPQAKTIAEAVITPAMAMGFERQILRANGHCTGMTEYQQTMAYISSEKDPDAEFFDKSDEELQRYASKSIAAMELPSERYPVIVREWESKRDIARERMQFCRHLNLMQGLRHTMSRETMYAKDPERLCICERFGYRSNIREQDWKTVIAAFKASTCAECSFKEPKDIEAGDNPPAK